MQYKKEEIKKGIKLHLLKTDKFKTNITAVFLTTKLDRATITEYALISTILRRGSKSMPTQEEISIQMEEMYGASFDCGLDKTGDNQVLKFYIETINDKFIPNKENILEESIENILEIVFNPLIEENAFKNEYVEQEKINMKHRIEGKIDNKARYALDRTIEEMYKDEPFGLYKYGYVEDLEKINSKELYQKYKELISLCKIDIFVSGKIEDTVKDAILNNENIKNLEEREADFIVPKVLKKEEKEEKTISESMDVTQGKLIIGLDVNLDNEEEKYVTLLYNSILGGSANSKIFQNVREKAHLAYAASSSYMRFKSNIFISCGIEIANYEKALSLIKEQLEQMKNGDFSEDDIEEAKKGIIATIKTIDDEQDTQITYYFGQELSQDGVSVEEYQKKVEKVKKEDIVKVAKDIKINTIYFLRD